MSAVRGEWVCLGRKFFGQKGVVQLRMHVLFGESNFGFFEIYDVSARTRGLSQCGHVSDKRVRCQFFANLKAP